MCVEAISGILSSIQVAEPKTYGDAHESWTTSFFKLSVEGPVWLGYEGLSGDQVADTRNHGGADKAVLGYSANHLEFWEHELGQPVGGGGFGENFTIDGMDEDNVCIGDVWTTGEVSLEVSQPRQPCWKLGRRWSRNDLPKLVVQNGRSGWYFRVLQDGVVAAGESLRLVRRPHPDWTVARASRTYYGKIRDEKVDLAQLEKLSVSWRNDLAVAIGLN